jgi:hypothetical protein
MSYVDLDECGLGIKQRWKGVLSSAQLELAERIFDNIDIAAFSEKPKFQRYVQGITIIKVSENTRNFMANHRVSGSRAGAELAHIQKCIRGFACSVIEGRDEGVKGDDLS